MNQFKARLHAHTASRGMNMILSKTKTTTKAVALSLVLAYGATFVASGPAFAGKPAPKPAPKKAASKTAVPAAKGPVKSGASNAAMNKAIKDNKPKGLAAMKNAGGGAPAVLSGFASTLGSLPKDLGQIVPMSEVIKKLKADVKSGKVLPGDPTILEYERWLKEQKGKPGKDAVAPGELSAEQKQEVASKYTVQLIGDVKAYALFITDFVLAPRKITKPADAADAMYQYGCRSMSRLLPGFAKIVEMRIKPGVDTTGDWDAPFTIVPESEGKKDGDKGGAKNNPPPQEEIVEICSVTHKQMEETLKKDLLIIAKAVKAKTGKPRDLKTLAGDPKLSGKDAPADVDQKSLETYDKAFKGLTFQHVTKRLLNFYRKKGTARNFARAVGSSKDSAARFGKRVDAKTPTAAKKESKHHSDPKIVDARAKREVLRRAVEQWTYGYEYESVAQVVIPKKQNLLKDYKGAEGAILDEFWSTCQEIQSICEEPVEALEVKACTRCAMDALNSYCADGKDSKGKCREIKDEPPAGEEKKGVMGMMDKVMKEAKKAVEKAMGFAEPRRTLKEWLGFQLAMEAHRAAQFSPKGEKPEGFLRRAMAWVIGKKFFAAEEKQAEGFTRAGMRYLDSLPLTTWQRCILWNPAKDAAEKCAKGEFGKLTVKDIATMPWDQALMAKEAYAWKPVKTALANAQKKAGFLPLPAGFAIVPTGANPKDMAVDQKKAIGESADAAADVAGPIVGKLLGMLLQAAGLNETMKVLAQAAGMTPQQSADCEDREYRHDVMKLVKKDEDNKRTCLQRVFAKNFTNVLESIIIMLGNKLVDWGVDLIRNVLQPAKSALLASAGSVPFAGGFLATLVDIVWELLMNFGAKTLLKGFIIAKLPEWLKVRELAQQPFQKVMEHPIVQVVLGIILMLIDAAMVHGDKSWMDVGVETTIAAVQKFLENPPGGKQPEWFWLRALTYAKKKLRESGGISKGDGTSMTQQIGNLAKAMLEGFFAALSRKLDAEGQASVEEAKNELLSIDFAQLASKLASNPMDILKVLREKIAPQIGKLILPVVAAFAPLPGWAKQLLVRVGNLLGELISGKGSLQSGLVKVVETLEPLGQALVDQVPIADPTLKTMLSSGYSMLLSILKDPASLPQKIGQPGALLKAFIDLVKPVLVERANALLTDPALAPAKAALNEALTAVSTAVGGGSPSAAALTAASNTIKTVVAALVPMLESAASKAFAYPPLRELVSKGIALIASLVSDPQALVQKLKSGETFAKELLGKLDEAIGGFATSSITLMVPAGFGRTLALAAVDAVRATLKDPSKVKKLVQDAQGGIGKLAKSLLSGPGGLISMLLGEIKSDALKGILQMGIDFVFTQIVK